MGFAGLRFVQLGVVVRQVRGRRVLLAACLGVCGTRLFAQAVAAGAGTPLRPAPADPAIARALAGISPERVRADIATLVSFRNRSTLSSMETDLPAGTGINAAADWIEAEFRRYSAACNGCLDVKRDTFTEPGSATAGSRIARPTRLVNVYAVLRGSDPAQAARRVLVTGHYDSRVNDVMDTHAPAPGANDDASGVAVSLECARVLSRMHLPATVVFVAVAGEEQGLNGSRHLAQLAKEEGWQLEAVLNNDIVGGDTTPGETAQDKSAVRVFSEGVPGGATPDDLRRITALGAESDSTSRELARAVTEVAGSYFGPGAAPAISAPPSRTRTVHTRVVPAFHPVLVFRRDRFLRGGDHTSFNAEGFAAVRFTEWRENFNHQHQAVRTENGTEFGDLLQFVDTAYVANVARLNAATLANLAAAPPPPVEVHVLTKALDNNIGARVAAGGRRSTGDGLRDRLAADGRGHVDDRVGGGRSPSSDAAGLEGQRRLWGAERGRRRPSQRGRAAGAGAGGPLALDKEASAKHDPTPQSSQRSASAAGRQPRAGRGQIAVETWPVAAVGCQESSMPRSGSMSLSLPSFSGATRKLILVNVAVFFALALLGLGGSRDWVAADFGAAA